MALNSFGFSGRYLISIEFGLCLTRFVISGIFSLFLDLLRFCMVCSMGKRLTRWHCGNVLNMALNSFGYLGFFFPLNVVQVCPGTFLSLNMASNRFGLPDI